ncbi:MAG TPA: hypothetical protein VLF69_03920 [Candidatus Saccharimonadales bacterium]|nr:hypothetical protein [Candidatus Saccharimonadales bacterium]
MQLSLDQVRSLTTRHGSPLYVYDLAEIRSRATQLQRLELPYGQTIRYAMKANPHPQIIHTLMDLALQFDASSSYEAAQLLALGVPGNDISLSSQQPAHNLAELLAAGVRYVATSLHQLELFAAVSERPQTVGLRVNPGMGSGHNNRLTTGGVAASFGLWHHYLPQALALAAQHDLIIDRLHLHVGTGGDPTQWGSIMDTALAIASAMPTVTSLDIGGGFKIAYAPDEIAADMEQIAALFRQKLTDFAKQTGRQLSLEIEPGRWLVAHSGCLLAEIVDIVDTGPDGFQFLRTNTGMNDFLRPSLYGAQHRMQVMNQEHEQLEYVVVGHCCETGDLLTPAPHEPEQVSPRTLNKAAIGDILMIRDTGAYCASMATKGYNAFPSASEVCINTEAIES